jgi:hypothetical protein
MIEPREQQGVAVVFACEPLLARKMAGLDALSRVQIVAGWFELRGRAVPASLRRARRLLSRAPTQVRGKLAAALVALHPELGMLEMPATDPIAAAYPRAPARFQARVALGEAPAALLPGLSAREAHEALSLGYHDAVSYLLRDSPYVCKSSGVRDVAVARWILACLGDPPRRQALLRESFERGPHGEMIHGVLASRVDEITSEDLPRGVATGVAVAFRSAAGRAWENWQREAETQHELLATAPTWWRPIRCARLLQSAAELVAEGREMGHCVASYAPYVRQGRSVVVSIAVPECKNLFVGTLRSTVEIDRHCGLVMQHKGPVNDVPHELCAAALRVCLRRWGLLRRGALVEVP